MYKPFLINFSLLVLILGFTSCKDNVSELGESYINSLDLPPAYEVDEIVAYSEKLNGIQTNNLTNYLLGSYNDPIYGSTETSILSQLTLSNTNNDFGEEPELDSVILNIPLFLTQTDTDEFELDSVIGEGNFRLKLFESNYFLRNVDPGENGVFENPQVYYSNQFDDISPFIESSPFYESDIINFEELNNQITLIDSSNPEEIDTTIVNPRLRLKLPVDFFQEKIIDKAGQEELISTNNFIDYFRGIHMVLEPTADNSVLFNFNLNSEEANITLHYNTLRPEPTLDPDEVTDLVTNFDEFSLEFAGVNVNLYNNQFNVDLADQNIEEGEENLYLKGGEGSGSIIKLFTGFDSNNDGISDQLEELRDNNWIINEANLILYVNDDIVTSEQNVVNRLFIYDIDNGTILEDYQLDPTLSSNPLSSASIHLPPLEESNGERFYRLRITNHINNVINKDSTNVKLGLSISQNVNNTRVLEVDNPEENTFSSILESSASSPRGTVLHGNNSPDVEKRLKLRIIYTETENN